METVIKILQFFLCFTIIVGLHELGHFAVARLFKIRVEKFYIFFNPWFELFKFNYKGTEYGLGWLPLGGYVKIGGMIDESMDKEQMAAPVREDDFRAKPAWQRFMVMIAGVVINLITAILIYCAVCYTWGESYLSNEDIKLGYTFNEEAHAMGFADGDRIVTIDGEPLDNYDNVIRFLKLVNHKDGLSIGYRHISLSTCGVVPGIKRLAEEELPITLSMSLHAVTDEKRSSLMPVNRKWNIDTLLTACAEYYRKTSRRISFEYTLLAGENDGEEEARALASLLKRYMRGMPIHVNLIRVNEVKERKFTRGSTESVRRFAEVLSSHGVNATVRRRLGSDIDGACGQLRRRHGGEGEK